MRYPNDQPAQHRSPGRSRSGIVGVVFAVHRIKPYADPPVWHSLAASSSKAWSRGRGAMERHFQPSPAARPVRALIAAMEIPDRSAISPANMEAARGEWSKAIAPSSSAAFASSGRPSAASAA